MRAGRVFDFAGSAKQAGTVGCAISLPFPRKQQIHDTVGRTIPAPDRGGVCKMNVPCERQTVLGFQHLETEKKAAKEDKFFHVDKCFR